MISSCSKGCLDYLVSVLLLLLFLKLTCASPLLPSFPLTQARISESRAVNGSSLYILNGPNPVIQRIAERLGWTAWAAAALQELLAFNSEIRCAIGARAVCEIRCAIGARAECIAVHVGASNVWGEGREWRVGVGDGESAVRVKGAEHFSLLQEHAHLAG